MQDYSIRGYFERMPTEYLEGILANPANRKQIADYDRVCALIREIIKEREKITSYLKRITRCFRGAVYNDVKTMTPNQNGSGLFLI